MRKTLITGLASLSLIICIGMLVLWVRSYWVMDQYSTFAQLNVSDPRYERRRWAINSDRGIVQIVTYLGKAPSRDTLVFELTRSLREPQPQFDYSTAQAGHTVINFPHWLVAMVALFPPLLWFIRFLYHRRIVREGLCPKCGYDLRASTDRCPECGTPIPVAAGNPNDQTRMTNQ